jgi:hypothetical protein
VHREFSVTLDPIGHGGYAVDDGLSDWELSGSGNRESMERENELAKTAKLSLSIETGEDSQGGEGICFRVRANSAGLLMLAYQCMSLAFGPDDAIEDGVHFHVEDVVDPGRREVPHTIAIQRIR